MIKTSVRKVAKNYLYSGVAQVRERRQKVKARRSLQRKLDKHFDALGEPRPGLPRHAKEDVTLILRIRGAWIIERRGNEYLFERITVHPYPSPLDSIKELSLEQLEYIEQWIERQLTTA